MIKLPQVLPHLFGLPWEKPAAKPSPPPPPPSGRPPPGPAPRPAPAPPPPVQGGHNAPVVNAVRINGLPRSSGSVGLHDPVIVSVAATVPAGAMLRGDCTATVMYYSASDKKYPAMDPQPDGSLAVQFVPADYQTNQGAPTRIDLAMKLYAVQGAKDSAPSSASVILTVTAAAPSPSPVPAQLPVIKQVGDFLVRGAYKAGTATPVQGAFYDSSGKLGTLDIDVMLEMVNNGADDAAYWAVLAVVVADAPVTSTALDGNGVVLAPGGRGSAALHLSGADAGRGFVSPGDVPSYIEVQLFRRGRQVVGSPVIFGQNLRWVDRPKQR